MARWQTEHVIGLLRSRTGAAAEPLVVSTEADRRLDLSISQLGGKGAFAREVQAAVLDGRADIAVHSAKDLPSITIPGLVLAAVPERGDPRDALVGSTLADLPGGAEVATGSLRRRAELWRRRPDLRMVELRGNMQTRLAKAAQHDAIVVAATALDRLGLAHQIAERLPVEVMVPQVAQAALGVECREGDDDLRTTLVRIEHQPTRRRVDAERAFLAELGGDCSLPANAHAVIDGDDLVLTAFLGAPDARTTVRATASGGGPEVGAALASDLRDRLGAG